MDYCCSKCNKFFASKTIAKRHEKTAKYCKDSQPPLKYISLYTCEKCNKPLSTNQRLQTHLNICKGLLQVEKDDCITEKHITESVINFTIEHFKKGSDGLALFILKFILKNKATCTDYSRQKIKYKNETKVMFTDVSLQCLLPIILKHIKYRICILMADLQEKTFNIDSDLYCELLKYSILIVNGISGKQNIFTRATVKTICVHLIRGIDSANHGLSS